MKILQVAATLGSAGGVESYLWRLIAELAQRDHEVAVIAGRGDAAKLHINVHTVPDYYRFGAADKKTSEVLRLAAEFAPDVIHIHEMNNYPLATALAERWPTLKHCHNDFTCASGGFRLFRRSRHVCLRTAGPWCLWHYYAAPCGPGLNPLWALRNYRRSRGGYAAWNEMKKVLVASHWVRDSFLRAGLQAEQVVVLPYFVPQATVSPRAAEAESTPEILFVGRIMPEKGLNDLIRALALVTAECRLVVVGEGPAQSSAENLARTLGLSERVKFAGWQEEVEPFYARASLLVVPSLWPEPFGIVGIEAMARALPVVAYRSGGIPEWLEDGTTGRLVEPGDVQCLASAMDEILTDAEKSRIMGESARKRQTEVFGAEQHIARLEGTYAETVEMHRRGERP